MLLWGLVVWLVLCDHHQKTLSEEYLLYAVKAHLLISHSTCSIFQNQNKHSFIQDRCHKKTAGETSLRAMLYGTVMYYVRAVRVYYKSQ